MPDMMSVASDDDDAGGGAEKHAGIAEVADQNRTERWTDRPGHRRGHPQRSDAALRGDRVRRIELPLGHGEQQGERSAADPDGKGGDRHQPDEVGRRRQQGEPRRVHRQHDKQRGRAGMPIEPSPEHRRCHDAHEGRGGQEHAELDRRKAGLPDREQRHERADMAWPSTTNSTAVAAGRKLGTRSRRAASLKGFMDWRGLAGEEFSR